MKNLFKNYLLMNMTNRFAILLFAVCLSSPAFSQQLAHVLGEVILKPVHADGMTRLVHDLQYFEGQSTHLQQELLVAEPMNLWLLQFDHTEINEQDFLNHLRRHQLIEAAQFNHLIKERAVPNDQLFMQQWQYINNGDSGGLVGCDLDAEEAWDISTGGVTVNGDTIVVCVIDSGMDADHEDILENLWFNYAEIPNNGIDDDNNGFVDDYRGWNASQNNDNIDGGNHGTAVAGIVGAKGNNNIGVAGVNWDVKLMIVDGGSSDEAQVLKAYAYPLALRKQYNATSGQEGAFVVATNASWGTDFGQAADAPLWCAFYDTLGVAGILNCGATINEGVNVDEVGDLPTTCASNYLIGVTNIQRSCDIDSGAGYGTTSIDLASFGTDAYNIANGNNYGDFGGTSAATPHVAGLIGLMYSAPCEALAALASNDPGGAALLIKEYILQGVTPNENLEGITVTGGHLNMKNSMQLVLDNCSACPLPSSIQAINETEASVSLIWVPSEPSISVNIRYRELGTTTWTELMNVQGNQFPLSNLKACTEYEYQLETNCTNESSGVSNFFTFKTDGCCAPPANIQTDLVDENNINLSWSSVLAAVNGYTLRFKVVGSTNWTLITSNSPMASLTGLNACTAYEMQVRSICEAGPTEYGVLTTITTSGCGSCVEQAYCESSGDDASQEWIEGVEIGDFIHWSGNDLGYGDFTALDLTLRQGETYFTKLTPGFANQTYFDYFKVWIDLDADGTFNDPEELVFDFGAPSNAQVTGDLTIPTTATIGSTRMRVSMKWTGMSFGELPPTPCEAPFGFGEVEDYCVTIIEPVNTTTIAFAKNILLSPNPFESHFSVSFSLSKKESIQFNITDLNGRSLYQATETYTAGEQRKEFSDLADLPSGVYFLTLQTGNGLMTRKVVK